jgi:hypothetical protein
MKNSPRSIYHITHINNLASIISEGKLWSDAQRIDKNLESTNIGYPHIKGRRSKRKVELDSEGNLGDYVPFYFCNRSIMLYVLSENGVPGYSEGQTPIVHLVSDTDLATKTGQPWGFTDRHAELAFAEYFEDIEDLDKVDWDVMPRKQWGGDSEVKEMKQAEFLVHDFFPWTSIKKIGVLNQEIADKVLKLIKSSQHKPDVQVERGWYY